MGTLDI